MINKNLILYICFGSFIGLIFISGIIIGSFSDTIKNSFINYNEKQILKNNNLNVIDFNIGNNTYISDYDLNSYFNYINRTFEYTKLKDCKYYSFNYVLYAIKHKIKYKYVNLNKHIFVILDYKNKYCLLDENNKVCFNYD